MDSQDSKGSDSTQPETIEFSDKRALSILLRLMMKDAFYDKLPESLRQYVKDSVAAGVERTIEEMKSGSGSEILHTQMDSQDSDSVAVEVERTIEEMKIGSGSEILHTQMDSQDSEGSDSTQLERKDSQLSEGKRAVRILSRDELKRLVKDAFYEDPFYHKLREEMRQFAKDSVAEAVKRKIEEMKSGSGSKI